MMRYRGTWQVHLGERSLAASGRQLKALGLVGLVSLTALSGALHLARSAESTPLAPAETAAATAPAPQASRPMKAAPIMEVDPATVGLSPDRLGDAVAAVRREIRRGAFPGAALAIGRGSEIALLKGIGGVTWNGPDVSPDSTVYDLASLTKVVATTTAVMLLVEDGKMSLDAPVQRYLPEFSGGAKSLVTVRMLLTHTSGLPAGVGVDGLTPTQALMKIYRTPLINQPGEAVVYSDLSMIVLFEAAQRAAGETVPQLLQRRVFGPLGMTSTFYTPGEGNCPRCAPTLILNDGRPFRGGVNDPTARQLGGVTGNAGLFSTAADLSRFAAMLASGGELNGVRILKPETIRLFTQRQPGAKNRALGWETPDPKGVGAAGLRISPDAFGHTGYTGTSLWVDPDRHTWTVLLTNRTFDPRASNEIQSLRRLVHDDVALAAVDRYRPKLAQ
jgi:CubicO group peptidase (beta-lactamase class C family)